MMPLLSSKFSIGMDNIAKSVLSNVIYRLEENDESFINLIWIHGPLSTEEIKSLMEAVKKNKILTRLTIFAQFFDNLESLKYLKEALEENNTLRNLELEGCRINDQGAEILGQILEKNSTIETLNLSHNVIGNQGIQHLGNALKKNKGLIELSLASNRFDSEGIKFLTESLKENQTLTDLILMNSNVNILGAKYIGNLLKENNSLKTLDLWNNKSIGSAGAIHLADALEVNKGLTKLDIDGCQIGIDAIKVLVKSIKKNYTLTNLFLESPKINSYHPQLNMLTDRNKKIPERRKEIITLFYCLAKSKSIAKLPIEIRMMIWEKLIEIF